MVQVSCSVQRGPIPVLKDVSKDGIVMKQRARFDVALPVLISALPCLSRASCSKSWQTLVNGLAKRGFTSDAITFFEPLRYQEALDGVRAALSRFCDFKATRGVSGRSKIRNDYRSETENGAKETRARWRDLASDRSNRRSQCIALRAQRDKPIKIECSHKSVPSAKVHQRSLARAFSLSLSLSLSLLLVSPSRRRRRGVKTRPCPARGIRELSRVAMRARVSHLEPLCGE